MCKESDRFNIQLMAKKNKKNLKQLLAKKQQLQNLEKQAGNPQISSNLPKTALPSPVTRPALTSAENTEKALPAYAPGREIWRTLISTAVIGVILAGIVIANNQQHFLNRFGDQLYQALNLDQ